MKNAELPCPDYWEGARCVDGDRCCTHQDCPYGCGDFGYLYAFEGDSLSQLRLGDGEQAWEPYKVPCRCQTEKKT